jgi:hypothetical protein
LIVNQKPIDIIGLQRQEQEHSPVAHGPSGLGIFSRRHTAFSYSPACSHALAGLKRHEQWRTLCVGTIGWEMLLEMSKLRVDQIEEAGLPAFELTQEMITAVLVFIQLCLP